MNEETKELDNDGLGPCLALYHPNARYTGSALRMWLHPAVAGQDGCISLKIAEQDGSHDRFDWAHALYAQLKAVDLAKLIMVFQGWIEATRDDVFGDNRITVSMPSCVITVDLRHQVDPSPRYVLTLISHPLGQMSCSQRQITLLHAEALAISEAIRGAMSRVAFGDTLVMCGIDYGKEA